MNGNGFGFQGGNPPPPRKQGSRRISPPIKPRPYPEMPDTAPDYAVPAYLADPDDGIPRIPYTAEPGPGLAQAGHFISHLIGQSAHGVIKTETLYRLARCARNGVIAELGTYLGSGQMALGYGTRDGANLPLYAVYDYADKNGWTVGEHYGPPDLVCFQENMAKTAIQPYLIQVEGRRAAAAFLPRSVALLVWDIAQFGRLEADFAAWADRIKPGGVFAIRDMDYGQFNAPEVTAAAVATGQWTGRQELPGFIWVVTRV